MKIVLRQDVPKLGEAGTIQNVKPGFARNYLIPQGFAVLATPGEIKTAEHNQEVKARKIAKQEAQLQTLADKIAGKRLEFTVRAGESGRLYGSITAGDIATEHYAFLVTEEEFDEIFGRITEQGIQYWADPHGQHPGEINHNDGGRGVYWPSPDGHWLEIITRPYGSGG